ncbi:MAG: MarR family transcriptional regulator [Chloroflexota bacterium]
MDDEPVKIPYADGAWFNAWRGVLYASARVLRVADPALIADVGIPLTWLDVLSQLNDAGGSMRVQELQDRSLFTRSGMTRLIDRIEEAGLVRREAVPGDRRGVRVALTEEGRQRLAEAFAAHLPVLEREFGRRLTPEQHRAVADALATFWNPEGSPD